MSAQQYLLAFGISFWPPVDLRFCDDFALDILGRNLLFAQKRADHTPVLIFAATMNQFSYGSPPTLRDPKDPESDEPFPSSQSNAGHTDLPEFFFHSYPPKKSISCDERP